MQVEIPGADSRPLIFSTKTLFFTYSTLCLISQNWDQGWNLELAEEAFISGTPRGHNYRHYVRIDAIVIYMPSAIVKSLEDLSPPLPLSPSKTDLQKTPWAFLIPKNMEKETQFLCDLIHS
ncbi:hypothetical protein XELAEV_18033412mg [Xenopus laevis]|uniref:Uncharacterized protein n=1 Tax=Xenopus laevis TaxID=8355 RepID=A0A974HDZ0_XENLA|nr:hypothetical protein XELAEV_18033412mg [Xenopus laevis]